jgi:hypothetical protein
MGLAREGLAFINRNIANTVGELSGKKMLELGNQHIDDDSIPEKTGKEYFENRGVNHISVDLNGLDGALRLDLSKPRQFLQWNGYFDIITNFGTSEHVEPKSVQYECFLIMHSCLRVGGIAIHLLPDINELENKGCWRGHCANYYSMDFFKQLAENNNYKLVSLEIINGLVCSCLQKQSDIPFMEERDRFLEYITRKKIFIPKIIHYIRNPLEIPNIIRRKLAKFINCIR